MTHHHRARLQLGCQRHADPARQRLVQLVRHAAADVVCLECGEGHRKSYP